MEREAKLSEGSLSYEISEGDKLNIVFLHGFPFNRKMWRPQFDFFGKDFRVLTPDFRAHGKSSFNNYPWTISHLADDLKEFFDSISAKQVVLCGLSMGGYVALEFFSKYPEYVKGLILCDTKADTDGNLDKDKRQKVMKAIALNGSDDFAREFSRKCIFENAEKEKLILEMVMQNEAHNLISGLLSLAARKDQREILAKISVPTLVLCGEKDVITPPSESEYLHRQIRNSEYFLIPHAGHVSNLQNPQFFNQCIENFLKKIS